MHRCSLTFIRLRPALGFGLHVILDLVHEVLQKVQDPHFLVDIP